jgi:hypothetical protein
MRSSAQMEKAALGPRFVPATMKKVPITAPARVRTKGSGDSSRNFGGESTRAKEAEGSGEKISSVRSTPVDLVGLETAYLDWRADIHTSFPLLYR